MNHGSRFSPAAGRTVACLILPGLLCLGLQGCRADHTKSKGPEARPGSATSRAEAHQPLRNVKEKPVVEPRKKKAAMDKVVFTILFDSRAVSARLGTGWGFACLVESNRGALLFDTGTDGRILLGNLEALGRDPSKIRRIVISHHHGDHTRGLAAVLSKSPGATVFLPSGVRRSLIRSVKAAGGKVSIVDKKTTLDDVFTVTGPLGGSIPEQALVVHTPRGITLVTGCAHPRIEKMLAKVKAMTGAQRIYGLIGGLHLSRAGTARIQKVIRSVRNHGVELLAAGHCTGNAALAAFAKAFPGKVKAIASGTVIEISRLTGAE